jgi:hypothetical protein
LDTYISLEAVQYLIEVGADDYNTALSNICSYNVQGANDNVVLYLINKGANNTNHCVLNMYKTKHPSILKESEVFRMLLHCCDHYILSLDNQLNLVRNGIGVLLNKNPKLLEHSEAIPYINYRKTLLKQLQVMPLVPDLINVVASYIEYTMLGSLARNNKTRVVEFEPDD